MTNLVQSPPATATDARGRALARLEAWLEGWRSDDGYGGPVAHWWRHALRFTSTGRDWRYEGIIHGYLTLHARTGNRAWLRRAARAGEDLIAGQLPDGTFRNSCFELNPESGGTPHEAAASGALLRLAAVLRGDGDPAWQRHRDAGVRWLRDEALGRAWSDERRWFSEQGDRTAIVPNKAATTVEALFAWADLEPGAVDLERYARPTLDAIAALQVSRAGAPEQGGIAQMARGGVVTAKYLPIYGARCVPALLEGAQRFRETRYAETAAAVLSFALRWVQPDGSLPLAVYPGGRANRDVRWQAALADVLRAGLLLRNAGVACNLSAVEEWWLAGQQGNGSFATARGFGVAAGGKAGPLPDLLDILPVAGWNDKAFRYLALTAPAPDAPYAPGPGPEPSAGGRHALNRLHPAPDAPGPGPEPWETPCTHRGRELVLHEDRAAVWATERGETVYRWDKGQPWATVAASWLWQR